MDQRMLGGVLIAGGAVLFALSAMSDLLEFGSEGFGWKQVLGVSVGVAALLLGAGMLYLERQQKKLRIAG